MRTLEILLARHGATAGNLRNAYLGVTDDPLCPEGRSELRTLDPAVETVYVTPLIRTQQTAEILFPNARQIIVPGLAEMNFGEFENKNYEELSDDAAYRTWLDGGCEAPCPGGESRRQFCDRACTAFASLVSQALEQRAPRLVIVAHGGVVMAVGERFAVPKRDYYSWRVSNGTVSRFTTDGSLWSTRQILTVEA